MKLLDGEKASHGEKTLGQGPYVSPNPVDFPSDMGSFGNKFRLPKGNFEFGSSSGMASLKDHPLSYIGGGDVNMTETEYENQFGVEQAYGHPPEQQGYACLNNQPDFEQDLAIAQSLNADMEQSLCNLRAENKDLKAKCELAFSSYNNMLLDLNKSKQHEVDLSNMLSKVYKEKTDLTEDLGWVLRKEENRHQDPRNDFVPQRVIKAIAGFKSIRWECMNDVIGAPVLLLRYVLHRHGEHSGHGPSA
ncbi:hypothetical protein Tco_0850718 [Tanacetum coccineum]